MSDRRADKNADRERAADLAMITDTFGRVEVVDEHDNPGYCLDLLHPREPIPPGWLEGTFSPAVTAETDWEVLDDVERRINGLIGYLGSEAKDKANLEAALRAIEIQRGLLLGPAEHGGDRRSREFQVPRVELETEGSPQTRARWRKLAQHRDVIWPLVIEGARKGRPERTSQRYCLDLITDDTDKLYPITAEEKRAEPPLIPTDCLPRGYDPGLRGIHDVLKHALRRACRDRLYESERLALLRLLKTYLNKVERAEAHPDPPDPR